MTQVVPGPQANSLTKLRAAARTLFVRDGYHHTRPQDIAREAGVANGTFYLHFKDKREAFLDFAGQAQAELLADYRQRLQGVSQPRERLRTIFNTIIDFAIRHPGVLHAAFFDPLFIAPNDPGAWEMYDRMGYLLDAIVGDSNATDVLGGDFDSRLISHCLCGMFGHAMTYAARHSLPRDQVIEELLAFLDRALPLGQ